jgi:hypothetical protein
MLWQYRIDIDNLLSIHLYMYIRRRYRRYRHCCDDIVSISTIDFLYITVCTYCVDTVDNDNVVTISYWYRQFTFHTPLHVHTMSISTMLWRYRVDIDNWLPIHYCVYVLCRYRRYWQYCDDIVSISTTDFPYTFICTYIVDTTGYLALNYQFYQS